jgi:putative membrane protein
MIQPVLGFIMIILIFVLGTQFDLGYSIIPVIQLGSMKLISVMIGFFMVFIITTFLWISILSAPFKKEYNFSGLELAAHGLGQFTEQNDQDVKGLEKFFASFGTSIDIPVDVIGIKTTSSEKKDPKYKAILIVPGIHPGPFGYAGGSNLPYKLATELNEYTNNVLVFHSASTHDYNPVRSEEVQKIVAGLKKILNSDRLKFNSAGSNFVRISSKSSLQICAQIIGPGLLLAYTSSPAPTDDLEFEIGEQAVKQAIAKSKFAETAMFIDAHNCLEKGVDTIKYGSKKSQQIHELVEKSITKLNKTSEHGRLRAGIAKSTQFSTKEGVGPLGIQVLVIETGRKKVAYVMVDGNNMIPGLREQIRSEIVGLVDEAEIFTSDNHVVNITMGGYNPIGLKSSSPKIISTIQDLLEKAIKNLENVNVGADRVIVKNVNVFGKGNTVRLSRTINKTILLMGKSSVVCNLLAIIGCILIYFLII